MKRHRIELEQVVEWNVLVSAARRAAQGKRVRGEVRRFMDDLDCQLQALREGILAGTLCLGMAHSFQIHDPKPRTIYAPCFRERVLHHALMSFVGPLLDRALCDDSFACRIGKGAHAAVRRAQHHSWRFVWFTKMDVRAYFANVSHRILKQQLARKIKGDGVLRLLAQILAGHEDAPERGLPIGALTSQAFANFYLGELDRFCLEVIKVRGYLRYMDDFLCWYDTQSEAIEGVRLIELFLKSELDLDVRQPVLINKSQHGVTVCGYQVFPGMIRLTKRRKRRYLELRRGAERRYQQHRDSLQLQADYACAHALIIHADSAKWRRSLALNDTDWYEDV